MWGRPESVRREFRARRRSSAREACSTAGRPLDDPAGPAAQLE